VSVQFPDSVNRVNSRLPTVARPLIAACVAVVFLGLPPVLTRSISAPPPVIVMARLWTIIPIWFVVMRLSGGRLTRDVARLSLPSGVLFGASTALSVEAFKTTSIANATLIPSMQPVIIMVLAAHFYGERRARRDFVFAALALVGVLAVAFGPGQTSGASRHGDVVSVGALLVFVGYLMRLKKIRNAGIPVMAYMLSMLTWAALVVTPWALMTAGSGFTQLGGGDWALVIGTNLCSFIIGHGLLTWAQASIDVSTTALLQLGSPVISMIGAWWIHDQHLAPAQFIGGGILLASLAAIVTHARPEFPVPSDLSAPILGQPR
jgi:drug/metabolite transporter (DMT)-like permease